MGNVLVFFLMILMVLIALLAMAVDYGYLCAVRTQLQRTADAAALAGASGLYRVDSSLETAWYYGAPDPVRARLEARRFVRFNPAATRLLDVKLNEGNSPDGEIVIGRLFYPPDRNEPLNPTFDPPNTVRVRTPLAEDHLNGAVGLFFARALGIRTTDVSASAAATVWYPSLLPFATSTENWESLAQEGAGDNYTYRPGSGDFGVVPGPDTVPEIVFFPGDWNGDEMPPGNFGLVQIGPAGGELTAVRRQVDMGPSVADMEVHGGKLSAGDPIPGRTGLKSAAKKAFLGGWADDRRFGGMLGHARMLPLYEHATGNGNNAVFTLSRFVAVRVMALGIDGSWRTGYQDTEGDEITAILVQPVTGNESLIRVHLTR